MLSRQRATHSGYPVEIIVRSETLLLPRLPYRKRGPLAQRSRLLARDIIALIKCRHGHGRTDIPIRTRDNDLDRGVTLGRLNRRNIVTIRPPRYY